MVRPFISLSSADFSGQTGCFVDSTTFCIAAITSVVEKAGWSQASGYTPGSHVRWKCLGFWMFLVCYHLYLRSFTDRRRPGRGTHVLQDGGKLPAELPQYELFMTGVGDGTRSLDISGSARCSTASGDLFGLQTKGISHGHKPLGPGTDCCECPGEFRCPVRQGVDPMQ